MSQITEEERKKLRDMCSEDRAHFLKQKYPETYEWLDKQPCSSYDFVSVPIETLSDLFHE